ncbi:MAG: hypothetical protein H6692_03930 [Gemmatimonadales bacterium]|nr:hypothetical protein [Gemmatimonadales bacterium]MCB9517434.1 hypothetical protein [Gemmatimonadales bacterium]
MASGLAFLALAAGGCMAGGEDPAGTGPVNTATLTVTLEAEVSGLPADLTITGPSGFVGSLTGEGSLTGLAAGTYQVQAAPVTVAGDIWDPEPASQTITIDPAASPVTLLPIRYRIRTGSLGIAVSGLPAGAAADLLLEGPGGFTQHLTNSGTIRGLVVGSYRLTSAPVTAGGGTYRPTPVVLDVQVNPSRTPRQAAVSYARVVGALAIGVTGLPAGVPAELTLSGPGGFTASVTGSTTLTALDPGTYQLLAGPVSGQGNTWAPTPTSQTITVADTTSSVAVAYAPTLGGLALSVAGLPGGTDAAISITGPGGFSATATGSRSWTGLTPGNYTVTATPVATGAGSYDPSPASQVVEVIAGVTPAAAGINYTLGSGIMAVTIVGLPTGAAGAVTVSGPAGYSQLVTGSSTLSPLAPGSYTVSAANVTDAGTTWAPTPASQVVVVPTGGAASATITYAASTGGLSLAITGLPGGTNANVTVTGPGGFSAAVASTTTLTGLAPGSYTIAAASVTAGGNTYAPSPASQSATVTAGATASRSVTYAVNAGSLALTISGLPGGTAAAITVTGPGGYSSAVTSSTTLSGLVPGSYTITAAAVSAGGGSYAPTPTTQSATVSAGSTASRSVSYALSTGSLAITVSGLPGGTNAAVSVTGPGGYSAAITATTTLSGLAAGSYTIAASAVSAGGSSYTPTPASQAASVTAGATATRSVTYATGGGGGATLNLRIDGMYLTQAAQRYDGTVPLVAGRDAYLRVFGVANEANSVAPAIRVRLYHGGSLHRTYTIPAPTAAVPQSVNEGSLLGSWNVLVDAADVVPGMTVLADIDPGNGIAEANESDNSFPTNGTPGAVDVRTLPTFTVRFVPVQQQVNGLQGDVTLANVPQFMTDPSKMLPIAGYSADVRSPYVTTAPVLQSSNGNGAWGTILSEVLALKAADGSSAYYYGVVKTTYSSGVAGIGYVGGGARTALGWDRLPSASGVMAHEIGHNMGRSHVACGGPSNPDPNFPYANGSIGIWGLDVPALSLRNPSTYKDLMSYCGPEWVSDYTWAAMLGYRQGGPNNLVAGGSASRRGLLVWGRITPNGLVLEPAFAVDAPPTPVRPGPHRVELRAADGTVLGFRQFATELHSDLPTGTEEAFAFVMPLEPGLETRLASVQVRAGGRVQERRVGTGAKRQPAPSLRARGAGASTLEWDATDYPMVLVREAGSGRIVSFARGGTLAVPARTGSLRLTFSDGVRTVERAVDVP